MKFEDAVKYVGNKYPDYNVHQISAMASEIYDAYIDGHIAGTIEAKKEELAFLDDVNHNFKKVTVHSNRDK